MVGWYEMPMVRRKMVQKVEKCMGSTKSAKIGVWYEMPVVRKKMVRKAINTRVVRKVQKYTGGTKCQWYESGDAEKLYNL